MHVHAPWGDNRDNGGESTARRRILLQRADLFSSSLQSEIQRGSGDSSENQR